MDDLERASECLSDVARRLRRRGGGHPEQRRFAECLETPPDEEVVGAEVVAPHAHAVHLVHDDEPDPDVGEELDEARLPQALGCRVDEARLPGRRRRRVVDAVSSGVSEELTNVAVDAICGGSLSTWSFMSAMSGERTSVGSGRSIAAS